MLSFLNKDIDITNKTKDEIQESLLTQKQFNFKLKDDSSSNKPSKFNPISFIDNNTNTTIYIIVVKQSEKNTLF